MMIRITTMKQMILVRNDENVDWGVNLAGGKHTGLPLMFETVCYNFEFKSSSLHT